MYFKTFLAKNSRSWCLFLWIWGQGIKLNRWNCRWLIFYWRRCRNHKMHIIDLDPFNALDAASTCFLKTWYKSFFPAISSVIECAKPTTRGLGNSYFRKWLSSRWRPRWLPSTYAHIDLIAAVLQNLFTIEKCSLCLFLCILNQGINLSKWNHSCLIASMFFVSNCTLEQGTWHRDDSTMIS